MRSLETFEEMRVIVEQRAHHLRVAGMLAVEKNKDVALEAALGVDFIVIH
jgi:hypothetical protein